MATKNTAKKGCLMLELNPSFLWMDFIQKFIQKKDIYESEGIEDDPHVTILYGFLENVDPTTVLNDVKGHLKSCKFELNEIGIFSNEKFDVLKFDLNNQKLNETNDYLRKIYPYENDYPDYKQHCTIAYLNKGTANKYVDKFNNLNSIDYNATAKSLIYSNSGVKTIVKYR